MGEVRAPSHDLGETAFP